MSRPATARKVKKPNQPKLRSVKQQAAPQRQYKDLLVDFLLGGIELVAKRVETEHISESIIRRAAEELRNRSAASADQLSSWVDEKYPSTTTAPRGKTPPKVGDVRKYKAQQVSDGAPFLRLPLDTLGVKKQDECAVSFEDGVIKVRKV